MLDKASNIDLRDASTEELYFQWHGFYKTADKEWYKNNSYTTELEIKNIAFS